MKKMILIGALLSGVQAFGVTLEPGESIEWGRTVITCSNSSNKRPLCKLKLNSSGGFNVFIGPDNLGYHRFEGAALEAIARYRKSALCR